ncbi:hypothetical protein D9M72_376210 [compost metagenome]
MRAARGRESAKVSKRMPLGYVQFVRKSWQRCEMHIRSRHRQQRGVADAARYHETARKREPDRSPGAVSFQRVDVTANPIFRSRP